MALDIIFNPCDDAEYPAATNSYTNAAVDIEPTNGWKTGPDTVMVWATSSGYFAVGNGVTATASSVPVPANTPVYLKVPSGAKNGWKVSFFPITATGSAYAKPGLRN